jgi:hypothetical protein
MIPRTTASAGQIPHQIQHAAPAEPVASSSRQEVTEKNVNSPSTSGFSKGMARRVRSVLSLHTSSYSGLNDLTQKTYQAVKDDISQEDTSNRNRKPLGDLLKDYAEGSLSATDEQRLKERLNGLTYKIYLSRSASGEEVRTLGEAEQENLVRHIISLEDSIECIVQVGHTVDGRRTLSSAADFADNNMRWLCNQNLYIAPPNWSDVSEKDTNGNYARLSLTLKPQHIGAAAGVMIALFEKFKGVVHSLKVTQASKAGDRSDSIIVYITHADYNRAKEIEKYLRNAIAKEAWVSHTPYGMHSMGGVLGLSYGAFNSASKSSSFGWDRSDVVTETIMRYVKTGKPAKRTLEQEMKAVLQERGYSTENPAWLAGTENSAR